MADDAEGTETDIDIETDIDTETDTETDTGVAEANVAEPVGDAAPAAPTTEAPTSGIANLEHEGEIAADYLEALLDILDLDGDLDLDVEADRASVAIVGDGLENLVGSRGEVLEALQELTRLAVLQESGTRSRLMLDIGGFRAQRRTDLERMAGEIADRVRTSGEPERLAPMSPFERKVVHDAIAAAAGLVSESEGEEPQRRVVVRPA